MIPSKETIEYARKAVLNEVARFEKFEAQSLAHGEPERARRHRNRREGLQHLLGEGGGCVIAPFDARWLDDNFRRVMTEVREERAP